MSPVVRFTGAVLLALCLSGCASKDPMDYLPDCPVYFAFNAAEARRQAGAQQVVQLLENAGGKEWAGSMPLHGYFCVTSSGQRDASYFGAIIGPDGFSDNLLKHVKNAGAIERQISGRKTMRLDRTSAASGERGTAIFCKISDTALLVAPDDAKLADMIACSKGNTPGARNRETFTNLLELEPHHVFSTTVNPAVPLGLASAQLAMLQSVYPKGVDALTEIRQITAVADWDKQPTLDIQAFLPAERRQDLAGLVNFALKRVTAGRKVPQFISDARAIADEKGIYLSIAIPQESAKDAISSVTSMVGKLPPGNQAR